MLARNRENPDRCHACFMETFAGSRSMHEYSATNHIGSFARMVGWRWLISLAHNDRWSIRHCHNVQSNDGILLLVARYFALPLSESCNIAISLPMGTTDADHLKRRSQNGDRL